MAAGEGPRGCSMRSLLGGGADGFVTSVDGPEEVVIARALSSAWLSMIEAQDRTQGAGLQDGRCPRARVPFASPSIRLVLVDAARNLLCRRLQHTTLLLEGSRVLLSHRPYRLVPAICWHAAVPFGAER